MYSFDIYNLYINRDMPFMMQNNHLNQHIEIINNVMYILKNHNLTNLSFSSLDIP